MQIIVTQEDIDNGVPRKANACPLARALTRAYGQQATVGAAMWWLNHKPQQPLPEDAYQFREDFDLGKLVKPTTFEI